MVRILKPAEPLYADKAATYRAVLYSGHEWYHPLPQDNNYELEWSLIKKDEFPNPMAMKKIGEGTTIEVSSPQDYTGYELLLTAKRRDKDHVLRDRSVL